MHQKFHPAIAIGLAKSLPAFVYWRDYLGTLRDTHGKGHSTDIMLYLANVARTYERLSDSLAEWGDLLGIDSTPLKARKRDYATADMEQAIAFVDHLELTAKEIIEAGIVADTTAKRPAGDKQRLAYLSQRKAWQMEPKLEGLPFKHTYSWLKQNPIEIEGARYDLPDDLKTWERYRRAGESETVDETRKAG